MVDFTEGGELLALLTRLNPMIMGDVAILHHSAGEYFCTQSLLRSSDGTVEARYCARVNVVFRTNKTGTFGRSELISAISIKLLRLASEH